MNNTHRAVIEGSAPPRMEPIASGDKEYCEQRLADWLHDHPLRDDENAWVLQVVSVVGYRPRKESA